MAATQKTGAKPPGAAAEPEEDTATAGSAGANAEPPAKEPAEPKPEASKPNPAAPKPAAAPAADKGKPRPQAAAAAQPKPGAGPKAAAQPVKDPARATDAAPEHSGTRAAAPNPAAAMRAMRRRRARKLALRLAVFVGLPTAAASVYYGTLASDQFESVSQFTVYSAEMRPSISLESIISGVSGAPSPFDSLSLREYILSRDMLARLDREHGFIGHFRAQSIDWASRLGASDSFEDAHEYFRGKVRVDFDSMSGVLTLRVRAFSAAAAEEYSKAILTYSEEMVNRLAERARVDQTKYAQEEVKLAEARYQKARQQLTTLQQDRKELDPVQTASAALNLRTQLEGELAKARAELMQARSFMNPDAPQVIALTQKVNSISAQVAGETQRMVSPRSEKGLDTSIAQFETAYIEKEFAQKAYESALASLERARVEASRQHRYLATVATPSAPDETTHPRRLLSVFTVFVVSFLVMGIAWLLGSAVKEHARL